MTVSALVKVWVMSLSSGAAVYDSSLWVVQNRLIPMRANATPGMMGTGTFRMNRKARADDSTDGYITDSFAPVLGQYIAITTNACTLPGAAGTIWVGYIDGVQKTQLKATADEVGDVTAKQLGGVLDQIPVQNCKMNDPSGSVDAGILLLNNPTANMAGQMQGEVIGNAIDAPAGESTGLSYTRRQFATLPDHCGTANGNYWSRWALIDHVLHYVLEVNPSLPIILLSGSSDIITHLQTIAKEVIPLKGLTLKGLLDLLIGPSRGLYYAITVSASVWTVNIYSGTDTAYGTIPAVTPTTVNVQTGDVDVKLHNSGFDQYDAVEVTGNPVICAGTVSLIDSTLVKGWSSTEETTFKDAAKGATGYGALTQDQQIYRNRQVRRSGRVADVYVRYALNVTSSQDFACKDVSGVPTGTTKYLCPRIAWSGTTASADYAVSRSGYPPEMRVCRTVPWPVGKSASGTDDRSDEQKARPTYIQPLVIAYNHPDVRLPANGWADLCHPPFKNWSSPTLSADPRGPAIRIDYQYPETLAYTHWTGSPGISELDPTLTTSYGTSDYANLIVTLAVESDQRIKVIKYQSGFTSANIRNVLRINRPDLHCWFVPKYTFLGLKTDGTPDELAADTFVRNDWAVAEKLANEAAAFAFRKRTGATITIIAPDATPGWVTLGTMIGDLNELNTVGATVVTNTLNTYITNIENVFDANKARCIITTSDPPTPDSQAIAGIVTGFGGSPSSGGMVSTGLGCTVPQATQRLDTDVKEVQRQISATPILSGQAPTGSSPLYARIRWEASTVGVDLSECELTDSAGTALGILGFIDSNASLGAVRPQVFGNCWYEVVAIGAATRSAVTRSLFKAIAFRGLGTAKRPAQTFFMGTSVLAELQDSGGGTISTTINGSATPNYLPIMLPAGSSPQFRMQVDAATPVQWGLASGVGMANGWMWYLVPEIVTSGLLRSGVNYGTSGTAIAVNIDNGESFDITWQSGDVAHASGYSATATNDYWAIISGKTSFYYTSAGVLTSKSVIGGVEIDCPTSQNTSASFLLNPSGNHLAVTEVGVIASSGSFTATNTGTTHSINCFFSSITFVITIDVSSLRVISITGTVTSSGAPSGNAPTLALMVNGGRPDMWPYV